MFTEHVPPRFAGMDENWRNKFIEAMKWEDAKLRHFIDKCQLERWAASTSDLARKVVQETYGTDESRYEPSNWDAKGFK